jgi:hypothetical protein
VSQQALPQGATRRRAVFGLFDADGWTWAGLRAAFWFLVIIFLLAVVPNYAYFFTVSNTIQVGYSFITPINLCPAENEGLPCPAPAGATLPWQASPQELALPAARSGSVVFQSGVHVYLIGGHIGGEATEQVLTTDVSEAGNLTPWADAPALPEARTDAAIGTFSGIPYVIGGLDASGAPTATVFQGQVEEGRLVGWELNDELALPQPLSGAGVTDGTGGFVLLGGRDINGDPTNGVYTAWTNLAGTALEPWEPLEGLALPEPRADIVSATVGNFVYAVGGEGPDGATDTVFRLAMDENEAAVNEVGEPLGWAVAPEDQVLPEPRTDAAAFAASGAIYVYGGFDENGVPQDSSLWAVPDTDTGDYPGWERLDQTDLAVAVADAPIAGVGAFAFILGGETPDGQTDASQRAGLSPQAPFYQLGIAGATLPGLAIKGEVGQQLGYINAMTVGIINFVLLVALGVAFSRPAASRRVLSKLSGGRLKADETEQYGP